MPIVSFRKLRKYDSGDPSVSDIKPKRLFAFTDGVLDYFLSRYEGIDRDLYFAYRDTRNILDKSINEIKEFIEKTRKLLIGKQKTF